MRILLCRFLALICCGLFLASCSFPQVSQYAGEKPVLDLSEYFSGTIDAYGIFTDRSGEVKKRFIVLIKANWTVVDGKKVGILDESFDYFDGTKQKRIWTLTEQSPGNYIGRADDVVGDRGYWLAMP